jgi:hypothetical protein
VHIGGNMHLQVDAMAASAHLAAMNRDFPRAWQLIGSARRQLMSLGRAASAAETSLCDFEVALREGKLGRAAPTLEAADRSLAELGETTVRSTVLAMLSHVESARGRLDRADDCGSLAREMTQPDDIYSEVLWRTALAEVHSRLGREDLAVSLAAEAATIAEASDWLCLHGDARLALATVHARAGRHVDAVTQAHAALALYAGKEDLASQDRVTTFLRSLGSESREDFDGKSPV